MSEPAPPLDSALVPIRKMFLDVLPGRLEEMAQSVAVILKHSGESGEATAAATETLTNHAHNIAGVGGSLGFPELTELSRELERAVKEFTEGINDLERSHQAISRIESRFSSLNSAARGYLEKP